MGCIPPPSRGVLYQRDNPKSGRESRKKARRRARLYSETWDRGDLVLAIAVVVAVVVLASVSVALTAA